MNEQNEGRSPTSEMHASKPGRPLTSRRRGEVLEKAILEAAWEELSEVGYSRLTMEAVADRAKTNKAAVYRRWPSKARLVVAALLKKIPFPLDNVPDTGNLRTDLVTFLHNVLLPLQMIGPETIHGLMVEQLGRDFVPTFSRAKPTQEIGRWTAAMLQILKKAEARGEIHTANIIPRVLSLPVALISYEVLTTREPVSDETIAEIVDKIFLPLVQK